MYMDLQFPAVMQSWGTKEDWIAYRRTDPYPSRRAIVGLLGCALGVDKYDEVCQKWLDQELKSVRPKKARVQKRMSDDQIISVAEYQKNGIPLEGFVTGNNKLKAVKEIVTSMPFHKDYIVDTLPSTQSDGTVDYSKVPVVTIEGSQKFLEMVRDALLHPVYPYYLGRYCCTASECLLVEEGKIYDDIVHV